MISSLPNKNKSPQKQHSSQFLKGLLFLFLTSALLLGGWTTPTPQQPQKIKEETTPKGFYQGGRQAKRARGKLFPPLVRLQKLSTNKKRTQNPLKKVIVQRGVTLSLRNGRIVDVVFSKKTSNQAEWKGLIGSKYVVGDVDGTDVTPLLWRKLNVKLRKTDGSMADLQLLRPLWWLEATNAKEGGILDLHVPEAKIKGRGKVLKISESKADSRRLKVGENVVIGKIKHHNVPTIRLFFEKSKTGKRQKRSPKSDDGGDDDHVKRKIGKRQGRRTEKEVKQGLGVTPNHPLYSVDRGDWVAAGKLKVGEKLQRQGGDSARIRAIHRGKQKRTVFNMQVHRAKSYFVGTARVLAHNSGIKCQTVNLGGEGEVKGALNVQGPWVEEAGWGSSRAIGAGKEGVSLRELKENGHTFLILRDPHHFGNLPFGTDTVRKVITNFVPVDRPGFLGPGISSAEIRRILREGGEWWNNGVLAFKK